jgi:hypothetical protein
VRMTEPYGDFLTGKTITGWRSVDLREIASLRFRQSVAPEQLPARIMVTDANGGRLAVQVNDSYALEAIREWLPRSLGRTIRISPMAAYILGLLSDDEPIQGYQPAFCRDQGTLLRITALMLLQLVLYIVALVVAFNAMGLSMP